MVTEKVLVDPEALGELIAELVGEHVEKSVGSLAARIDGLERAAALKAAPAEKPRFRVKALGG